MAELTNAHRAMYNSFTNRDPHTEGVYKLFMDIYPAFAKKIFEGGHFVAKLVRTGMNPIDILDYHICGRCEALAPLDGYAWRNNRWVNRCTCMREGCGHTTVDPVTLREWMADELKHKAPPNIAEMADTAVDVIAASMMRKAEAELKQAMHRDMMERQSKAIVMPDGSEHKVGLDISVSFDSITDEEYRKQFEGTQEVD